MKVLIVEDEKDLNNVIYKQLKKNNIAADQVFNGEEALDYVNMTEYDVIILDIMMPKMNGYEFLDEIRKVGIKTPVLMLTAKDTVEDKVNGLNSGADDYLAKPFAFSELLARINALIRRNYGNVKNEIVIDDLVLDISHKSVRRNGKNIDLTGKEYEVLEYLMQNEGKILSREQILNHVWDYEYEGASNIIDVLIKNIRKKIDLYGENQLIFTKRGLGYVIQKS